MMIRSFGEDRRGRLTAAEVLAMRSLSSTRRPTPKSKDSTLSRGRCMDPKSVPSVSRTNLYQSVCRFSLTKKILVFREKKMSKHFRCTVQIPFGDIVLSLVGSTKRITLNTAYVLFKAKWRHVEKVISRARHQADAVATHVLHVPKQGFVSRFQSQHSWKSGKDCLHSLFFIYLSGRAPFYLTFSSGSV